MASSPERDVPADRLNARLRLRQWLRSIMCALLLGQAFAQTQNHFTPAHQAVANPQLDEALERAQDAQSAGRYADAAKAFADAITLKPRNAELWANRGLMEHFAQQYDASIASLRHAVTLKRALFTPHLFLGLNELELGNPEAALPHLEQARSLKRNDAPTALALGRVYAALHKPRLAMEAYKDAADFDPNNPTAWYGLAIASMAVIEQDGGVLAGRYPNTSWARALFADELLQQGRTADAVTTYREVVAASSAAEHAVFAETLRHMQQTALQTGSEAVSPQAWNAILAVLPAQATNTPPPCSPSQDASASPQNAHVRNSSMAMTESTESHNMACLYWQDRNAQCAKLAGTRLKKRPDDPEALFWSVKANERQAVAALTQFEDLAPQSAATFDLIGDLYRRRMQPDSALPEYAKALAVTPRDPAALLGRAAALLAIGRMEEAGQAAEDALTDSPNDPRLNLLLAETLIERHRLPEAEPHLKSVLATVSADKNADVGLAALAPRAHALLGRVKADRGENDEAIAEMNLGVSSDQDGSLAFQLSRLYRRVGKLDQAREWEEKARSIQAQRRRRATMAVEGVQQPQ